MTAYRPCRFVEGSPPTVGVRIRGPDVRFWSPTDSDRSAEHLAGELGQTSRACAAPAEPSHQASRRWRAPELYSAHLRTLSRSVGSTPMLRCFPGAAIPRESDGPVDEQPPQSSVLLSPLGRIRKRPAPGRIIMEGADQNRVTSPESCGDAMRGLRSSGSVIRSTPTVTQNGTRSCSDPPRQFRGEPSQLAADRDLAVGDRTVADGPPAAIRGGEQARSDAEQSVCEQRVQRREDPAAAKHTSIAAGRCSDRSGGRTVCCDTYATLTIVNHAVVQAMPISSESSGV